MANTVRGEVELDLGDKIYNLIPDEGRAVALDDALPFGILGTLLRLTDERSIKIRVLARIVHHLANESPGEEVLARELLQAPLMLVTRACVKALSVIAAGTGTGTSGEADAQSNKGTESIGADA